MKNRCFFFVLVTAGALLAVTGFAKLWSALGTARALTAPDPLSGIPFKYLLASVGVVEIVVATICFLGRSRLLSVGLVAWLSTNFLLYRIGLWWIGWKQPCGCMGSLTDALHIRPETADNIAKVILAYLLISSYGLLLWEWRQARQARRMEHKGEAKAPAGVTSSSSIQTGMIVLLLVASSLLCNSLANEAASLKQDTSPAEVFKNYLSHPPCVERLVYTDYSSFVPESKYLGAVNGTDYFCRQVGEGEDWNLRVSATNRIHPGLLFLGRWGLLRWTIRGFELNKSFAGPINADSDPYAVQVDMFRSSVDRVLNFGASRVLPGTFVWSGNTFQATADPIMTNGTGHPEFAFVKGTVKEENGKIVELSCRPFGGTFRYHYDEATGLPQGFPALVEARDPRDGKWVKLLQFHEIELAAPETINANLFTPEHHIDPEFAVVTSRSNNVDGQKFSSSDPRIVKLISEQLNLERPQPKELLRASVIRAALVFALAVPILALIPALLRRRQQTTQNKSMKTRQTLFISLLALHVCSSDVAACYKNSPYICHNKNSGTETLICLMWSTDQYGNPVQIPVPFLNQPWSETDGNRGLNCDTGSRFDSCRSDTIPNGCYYTVTRMTCDPLTGTPVPTSYVVQGPINTTITGGLCSG